MYTLWRTGHPINETVMKAFKAGVMRLSDTGQGYPIKHTCVYNGEDVASISYGILRGTGEIFNKVSEYWEIDRGYFLARHYDGYYRISLNGTRAAYNADIAARLPNDRLHNLRLKISEWKYNPNSYVLICPPTDYVAEWMGIDATSWAKNIEKRILEKGHRARIRYKDAAVLPLQEELGNAQCLVTYNSNVAIEALAMGIPAISFAPEFEGWSPYTVDDIGNDIIEGLDREKLFRFLSYCQFTLEEFQTGKPWMISQAIQKYGESGDL